MPESGSWLVIGADMGGTKIAAGLFRLRPGSAPEVSDAKPEVKYRRAVPGFESMRPRAQARAIENLLCDLVLQLASGAGPVQGVGLASAGFIEDGRIVEAANIGMKNHPLESNLARRTGLRVQLMRDSWAPVFAAPVVRPGILFSMGTGFGGVSCQADRSIPIKSHSLRRFPAWVPRVYANDDPGYAVAFSRRRLIQVLELGLSRFPAAVPVMSPERFAARIMELAAAEGKTTPGSWALAAARAVAGPGNIPFGPSEVFADFLGAAAFAGLVHRELFGAEPIEPERRDALAHTEPAAACSFFIQGAFVGRIIAAMQRERAARGLEHAEDFFGCGSGFNAVNQSHISLGITGSSALEPMAGLPAAGGITLLESPWPGLSLPALGAALGFGCRA